MSSVTINEAQRRFVLHSGQGYSCLGFDVVFKRLRQYAEMLGLVMPREADIGTLSQYDAYHQAEQAYIGTKPTETLFDPDTPLKVRALLEAYRLHGRSVRVFFGDTVTGRDWLEENDVIGTIGRSMGPIKVPLMIGRNQNGGPALLTACIVRMVDVPTKSEVYCHPKYQAPRFTVEPSDRADYAAAVRVAGELHARFKSEDKAHKWIAFMQGTRMTPH